jgi:hypothetical protein
MHNYDRIPVAEGQSVPQPPSGGTAPQGGLGHVCGWRR